MSDDEADVIDCPRCKGTGTRVYKSASLPVWATYDPHERRTRCSGCQGTGRIYKPDDDPPAA